MTIESNLVEEPLTSIETIEEVSTQPVIIPYINNYHSNDYKLPITGKNLVVNTNSSYKLLTTKHLILLNKIKTKQIRSISANIKTFLHDRKYYKLFNSNMKELYKLAIEFFGIDNVSIGRKRNVYTYYVLIRFPKLHVVSENTLEADIYGLNVYFSDDNYFFRGFRDTFKYSEEKSNYNFSHLSGEFTGIGDFCTGEGFFSLLNYRIGNGMYDTNFLDIKEFLEEFFAYLPQYLSWESITGTPYKYIKTLEETYSMSIDTCNCSKIELERIIQLSTINVLFLLDWKYNLNEKKYELKEESVIELLKSDVLNLTKDFNIPKVYKTNSDNYVTINTANNFTIKPLNLKNNLNLKFKNKPIIYSYVDDLTEYKNTSLAGLEEVINPTFIKSLSKQLETIFNNYLLDNT